MSQKEIDRLNECRQQAEYLVELLFQAGDDRADKCQRIAFMGGKYPNNETMLGGFGRTGLKLWMTEKFYELDYVFSEDPPKAGVQS